MWRCGKGEKATDAKMHLELTDCVLLVKLYYQNDSKALAALRAYCREKDLRTGSLTAHSLRKLRKKLETTGDSRSLNENWVLFRDSLLQATSTFTPTRLITRRLHIPWLNTSTKRLIKKKARLYRKHRLNPSPSSWEEFCSLRRTVKRLLDAGRKEYINKAASEASGNRRNLFKAVSCSKKRPSPVHPTRDAAGTPLSPVDQANLLSHYFSTVYVDEDPAAPQPLFRTRSQYMEPITVTLPGVLRLLQKLDPTTAMGPDGLHPYILKGCAGAVVDVVTYIISRSFQSSEIPSDWRKAHVTPVYKGGTHSDPGNYRPISVTCVCSKIAERVLSSSIWTHLDRHSLLSSNQHGFRRRFSTETLLLDAVDDWTTSLDDGHCVDMVLLDYAKAFDCVPHQRLVAKLRSYGLPKPVLSWVQSFLTDRLQRVVISGAFSNWLPVRSGVPQGSVLGPQLFDLYVDFPELPISASLQRFADDTSIYKACSSPTATTEMQADLQTIHAWSHHELMSLNSKKCKHIHFKRRGCIHSHEFTIAGTVIPKTTDALYLGVRLTESLSWASHIQDCTLRATRILPFLWANLRGCSPSIKELVARSLVTPHLDYCSAVWDPTESYLIHKLEMVQRKMARLVTGIHLWDRSTSITACLQDLGWHPLADRRRKKRMMFLYDLVCGEHPALHGLQVSWSAANDRTGRNRLFQPFCRTNRRHNAFLPRSIRDWNKLDPDTTALVPRASFANALQH